MYPIPWSIVLPSGRPELRRRRAFAACIASAAASLRAAGERTAANMNKKSTKACAPEDAMCTAQSSNSENKLVTNH
uniref:Uncharacterized protein n=1 Tax=Oryza barthii TaxID=65489 RepID=A0A0D3HBA8_9ORYZ